MCYDDLIFLAFGSAFFFGEGRHRNGPGAKTYRNGDVIDLTNDRKARNKAVNDYAVVIQEFFIRRTEDYLSAVGKEVLGIEYYWLRFEFAKGRGQIHAHILGASRATTAGTGNEDSALYFSGQNMNKFKAAIKAYLKKTKKPRKQREPEGYQMDTESLQELEQFAADLELTESDNESNTSAFESGDSSA